MYREAKNRRNTLCISRFFNEAGQKICRQDGCGDLFSASLMKTVTVEVHDLVYMFYDKVAKQAGIPVEEIMSNALYRMAGELAMRLGKGEMRWEPEEGDQT